MQFTRCHSVGCATTFLLRFTQLLDGRFGGSESLALLIRTFVRFEIVTYAAWRSLALPLVCLRSRSPSGCGTALKIMLACLESDGCHTTNMACTYTTFRLLFVRVLECLFHGNEVVCTQVVSHIIAPPPPPLELEVGSVSMDLQHEQRII